MALTREQDADLRRLHSFDHIGFLDEAGRTRLAQLRSVDRRASVREVSDAVDVLAPLKYQDKQMRGARCSIYPA